MNVTHIAGSPRKKGSSMRLAKMFLEQAEKKGAQVNTHFLNTMVYKGCQACYACKTTSEKCVLNDDISPVYDQLYDTDLIVLSSPVYFGDISAQLKGFFDRLFSLAKPDYMTNPEPIRLPQGKQVVMILSQNADEETHRDVYEKYLGYFQQMGLENSHVIRSYGMHKPEEVEADSRFKAQVDRVVSEVFN
jgi:multimeric flavodoxin WrbA